MTTTNPEDHLDIYVPGTLQCPLCEFQVVSQTLFMGSGEVGMTRRQALVEDVGEPCPNDGTPMVKVRWSDRCKEAERGHMKLIDDIIALTGAKSLPEALDGLKRSAEEGSVRAPAPVVMTCDEMRGATLEELRVDIVRSAARGQGPTFIAIKIDRLIELAKQRERHDQSQSQSDRKAPWGTRGRQA